MSHNVTYTPNDLAKNRIRATITFAHSEQKPSIGLGHIYCIIRLES